MTILKAPKRHSRAVPVLHRVSVGEAMHRGVLTVPLTAPLSIVGRMMAQYQVHCVVALGEAPYGDTASRVWGLISDVDFARVAASEGIEDRTAGGSATSEVVTVGPSDSVHHAVNLMSEHGVTHLIVVDPISDRPLGVLSTLDVAAVLAGVRPRSADGAFHVAQLMTTNVLTVALDTPLKKIAQLLVEHRISGVPVVENGRLLGIVSEADIVAKERGPSRKRGRLAEWFRRGAKQADQDRLAARTAGEAMTAPAITIESWRSAADAAALLLDRDVDRLPVLKDGNLVGIVTRADLVRAFARSDKEIEHDICEDVVLRSFWVPPGELEIEVHDGEVTLRGTVESEFGAELLPEAIQRVPGVVAVHSELHARVAVDEGKRFDRLSPR
jgi:CBS domain-containing protein